MAERVLVTGASGLIGRAVVRRLRATGVCAIEVLSNVRPGAESETIVADLLEPASRRKALEQANADCLFHLAWHSDPKSRWTSPENFAWAQATIDLASEFRILGGERAIFAGSCAEYGWQVSKLSEKSPLTPRTVYGQSKVIACREIERLSELTGLSSAWGRIFFCYGPGEPKGRLLGDLIRGLLEKKTVACTDGEQSRDFLYVDDVAAALLSVLSSRLNGPVNIGSGSAIKVREIIETVGDLIGHPELIDRGRIQRPVDDPDCIEADVTLLKSTGFTTKWGLMDGLRKTVDETARSLQAE